jgi:hypothetical protein
MLRADGRDAGGSGGVPSSLALEERAYVQPPIGHFDELHAARRLHCLVDLLAAERFMKPARRVLRQDLYQQ